jgi:hypothetical protein
LGTHPAGDVVFNRRRTNHTGFSEADKHGAGGIGSNVGMKGNGAELVVCAGVRASHGGTMLYCKSKIKPQQSSIVNKTEKPNCSYRRIDFRLLRFDF